LNFTNRGGVHLTFYHIFCLENNRVRFMSGSR